MAHLTLCPRELTLSNSGGGNEPAYSLAQITQRPLEWDRVVKTSHLVNCWYNWQCLFNVYAKDGLVLREEQVGTYPPPHDEAVPDLNPRGCQKGACFSHALYAPGRLKYPLKRLGPRGAGRWQRVSWDQALAEVADKIVSVLVKDGNEQVLFMEGTAYGGSSGLGSHLVVSALDLPVFNIAVDTADEHAGAAVTWGKTLVCDSVDNWFYADMLLVWGSNPAYTHIANFHYLAEARYHGTKIVAISPDYNASAPFADEWVPVNIGSDAALALAMCQVIVEKGLHKADFVREQTDLPLLVRSDNRKFLTQKDVQRGGRDNVFYFFDERTKKVVEAPFRTLDLGGVQPALAGEYEVGTLNGKVRVRPAFELLKEHLKAYTPQAASKTTGVSPTLIEGLATEVAAAKGVVNVTSGVWGKYYHGDLIERAQILLFALCGHFGRKGATFNAYSMLVPDSSVSSLMRQGSDALVAAESSDPRFAAWREQAYTDEMVFFEYLSANTARGASVNPVLFYNNFAGLLEKTVKANSWDATLKRPVQEYLDESLKQGWQVAVPKPGKPPKVLLEFGGQFLRRSRSTEGLVKTLLPQVELLVSIDCRMGTGALYADYILPAAQGYEKDTIRVNTSSYCPYLHAGNKVTQPVGEAKAEWEIFCRLAKAIGERAKAQGVASFTDRYGKERRLDTLFDQVTGQGLYLEDEEESVARDFYSNCTNVEQMEWEEFKEKGLAGFTATGTIQPTNACEIVPGETIVPLTHHTRKKQPYPTYTRRMQFYIDHDWFIELGEAFPAHKDNPRMGGEYPLQLTGAHARWSIHSSLVDNPLMLRLQRAGPLMLVSPTDAGSRGIADGDEVEVFNDMATFRIPVGISASVRPGQVIVYHGWENFQFVDKKHFKGVIPTPINPVELVGGYYHIRPAERYACQPGAADRGTRVDIRKAT